MDESTPQSSHLSEYIRAYYHVEVTSLHPLPSDSGKALYQVKLADGTRWILRVGEAQDRASFEQLAQIIIFLEQANYPAERIVFTAEQTSFATVADRLLMITTFLEGNPLPYTPDAFRKLGASVGRLHALTSSLTYTPSPSKTLPAGELAFAQQQLQAVAAQVPHQYTAQYEMLESALASMDRGSHLPTTLIHGDCHPANALMTVAGNVTLFDWEDAGMGLSVLDVGSLLMNCDGKKPWDALSSGAPIPDEVYLQAAIEGYSQHHRLTPAELDYLPEAIRFRSLVFGACSFASAIEQQRSAEFSQWWWHRYGVAEQIADQARRFFVHQ